MESIALRSDRDAPGLDIPQGLKPHSFQQLCGTAKAMP